MPIVVDRDDDSDLRLRLDTPDRGFGECCCET